MIHPVRLSKAANSLRNIDGLGSTWAVFAGVENKSQYRAILDRASPSEEEFLDGRRAAYCGSEVFERPRLQIDY